MAKTLLILATHFIDEAVISEFRKMQNTPNVDAVLAIDNENYKAEFKNRVEQRIFFGTSAKCLFFDAALHEEMKLTYFTFDGEENFGRVMWNNGDYRFYYVRKFFPAYDYYWMIEYDVFCNAPNYEGFLKKFAEDRSDLIVQRFRVETRGRKYWKWASCLDWVYEGKEIYGSFFPVVRLSGRAVDFLYKRRLAHRKIFQPAEDKRWIFCELFTPTELMNAGFSCRELGEANVSDQNLYLNDERFFLAPDNHLYHPVKSTLGEFAQFRKAYRKLFLPLFVERLAAITSVDLKAFPMYVEPDFNFVAFAIPRRGGDWISICGTKRDFFKIDFEL